MPAKKDIKPDYAQLSLRIDKKLNDDIEKYWRLQLYQDKTSFVREALDFYINAVKCEHCGAMNPKGSKTCGLCNTPLKEYGESLNELKSIIPECEKMREVYYGYMEDLKSSSINLKSDIVELKSYSAEKYEIISPILDNINDRIKKIIAEDNSEEDIYKEYYNMGRELLKDPTINKYIIHEVVINNKAYLDVIESKIQDIEILKDVLKELSEMVKEIVKTKK